MLAGSLVCEQDWHKLVKTAAPNPAPPLRKGKGNFSTYLISNKF